MPLLVEIGDNDTGKRVHVRNGGSLSVTDDGIPTFGGDIKQFIYRDYLRNSSGAFDMRVNGSVTSQDFYIAANTNEDIDRWITTLSFEIADASATLDKFGNLTALTNGLEIFYQNRIVPNGSGRIQIAPNKIKTNWQLIRLCGGQPAFGNTTNAFRANNITGSAEGYIPFLDFRIVFGVANGIKLQAGSDDKLVIRVNDNLSTGMDSFNVIASGFERLRFNE